MGALDGLQTPEAIARLTHWIGGNPYLARLAMQAAMERDIDLGQMIDNEEMRRSVFEHHLMHIRRGLEERPGMMDIVSQIASQQLQRLPLDDYCYL